MPKRGTKDKKLREEEKQAIGAIYKQYIDTFQDTSPIPGKTFVKTETLYAGGGKKHSEKGELYTPKPILKLRPKPSDSPPKYPKPRRSNLKSLGEELKLLQHERQAKATKPACSSTKSDITSSVMLTQDNNSNDYSNSTNLFVSNLHPSVTEEKLIAMFGCFGPLASVKIMWPRNDAGSTRPVVNNCGFVAFMSRIDAERALDALKYNSDEIRINWGKSVKLPTYPIHIPNELYEIYAPPPPSGLPFNAQMPNLESLTLSESILSEATIQVTIPFDRNLLMRIHRTIEFVVREGPEFETLLMNLEANNSEYNFLLDFQSPAHTYYRWKLFSVLQGDSKTTWSMQPFRMFKNGSIWIPPKAPDYKVGMPKKLVNNNTPNDTKLSEAQSLKLVYLIRNLNLSRTSIGAAMSFCLTHVNAINDSILVIKDSLTNQETNNPVKKISRLYLLGDVLYNCQKKKIQVEKPSIDECGEIFRQIHDIYNKLLHIKDKECLKVRILSVLRSWLVHDFYELQVVTKLENIFLCGNETEDDDDNSLNDEPLDGASLLKRSMQIASSDCNFIKIKKNQDVFDIFRP